MSDTPETGILIAHVYRGRPHECVYLSHAGAPESLCLDEDIAAGGDWNEAKVFHEDSPPQPPRESGLWEMRLPWRGVTAAELAAGTELCCYYTAKAQWTLLVAGPASAPGDGT